VYRSRLIEKFAEDKKTTVTSLLIMPLKVSKPPSFLQVQRYTRTITAILSLSKIILSLYSYCAKEGLVYIALVSPSSRQPSLYSEYT